MSKEINIILVAHDIPYPPHHGGRVDMWNRIIALCRCGVRVHLVTWSDLHITQEQIGVIKNHVQSVFVFPRNRNPILALHPKYPSSVISRRISNEQYCQLLDHFRMVETDIILLDGIHGIITAVCLAYDLRLPVVYRSHNVEHKYVRGLFEAENNLFKKLFLWSKIHRTFTIEYMLRRRAALIYDISQRDAESWQGMEDMVVPKVLSPYLMSDCYIKEKPRAPEPDIDILYIGNMHMSNNIYGLKWFMKEVVPLLDGMKIVLAGSNPVKKLRLLCAENNIQLIANPSEVQSLYDRAKVLINPIWHGSGVNIKIIEMLATGKPVVATSCGASGLTPNLKAFVVVADKPDDFAKAVLNYIKIPISISQKNAVVKDYNWGNVKELIIDLNHLINTRKSI
jgi:glycosyltransferase involved in cell wall biosynthesis